MARGLNQVTIVIDGVDKTRSIIVRNNFKSGLLIVTAGSFKINRAEEDRGMGDGDNGVEVGSN